MSLPIEKKKFTYRDYLTWPDDERFEIIEGDVYSMSPGPTIVHQAILRELIGQLYPFFQGKPCKVYMAPLDVRLPAKGECGEDARTVVQPDLMVVCDSSKQDNAGIIGAPDLVIEIASTHSASRDYVKKLALYESHGVREYWVIHQTDRTVMLFKLGKSRKYGRPEAYTHEDSVKSGIFPELVVDLSRVFQES